MNKRIANKIVASDFYWVSKFNKRGDMSVVAKSKKHLHLLSKAFAKIGDKTFIPSYKEDNETFNKNEDLAEVLLTRHHDTKKN